MRLRVNRAIYVKAIVIEGRDKLSLKELPRPSIGSNEVLIRVKYCGICGTDLHIFKGEFPVKYPLVPGHEFSGVVEEVGEGVTSLRPGDKVTVDPNISCGKCYYCRTGRANFCEYWKAIGINLPGAYAEYVKAPEPNVYKLPEGVELQEAAFTEPLSCVLHGLKRIEVRLGSSVAIFGLGPIGLLHLQMVKRMGASLVIGVDLIEEKIELAEKLGADYVINPSKEDAAERIKELTKGRGVDIAIEASGSLKAFQDALRSLDYSGKLLVFGVAPQRALVNLSPFQLYRRELSIIGSFINPYTTKLALKVLSTGMVNVKPLITRVLNLEETDLGFELVKGGKVIKVLLKP